MVSASGPGIFLRTHFWNKDVSEAVDRLVSLTQHPVMLAVDESRSVIRIDRDIPVYAHMLEQFSDLGLRVWPDKRQALWFSGDYVLYDLLRRTDFDPIVMIEYDAMATMPLDPLIERMVSGELDLLVPRYGVPEADWHWRDRALEAYRQIAAADPTEQLLDPADLRRCLFPFIAASRRLVQHLFDRRLKLAATHMKPSERPRWVYCEAFVPTEAHRAGFICESVDDHVSTQRFSHKRPIHVSEMAVVRDSRGELAHPVLQGESYVRKVLTYANMQKRSQAIARWNQIAGALAAEPAWSKRRVLQQLLEPDVPMPPLPPDIVEAPPPPPPPPAFPAPEAVPIYWRLMRNTADALLPAGRPRELARGLWTRVLGRIARSVATRGDGSPESQGRTSR